MPFIASMVLFALWMIVDSFHGYDKESLITEFEDEYYKAKERASANLS
jgi:hypothetical protein